MTTTASQFNDIAIVPGVMSDTDATASDVPCWVDSLNVRFDPTTGRLRKLGGWVRNIFNYSATILGTIRTIYSATINQKVYTVLGTNSNLYGLIGSSLTNISPLVTTATPAADSLATHYGVLAASPIQTVNGSSSVTVADVDAALYMVNDLYTLAGATTTNGILNTQLNAPHVIRSIGAGTVTFTVAGVATSTGTGGGAAVTRSDGLIQITSASHGLSDGERVAVTGATATGGIANTDINQQFIIRNTATNTFYVMTAGTATSAVTGGGGAGTEYFKQIDAGNLNQGAGQGYGAGLYGVGLYGTALVSSSGETYPRVWFCDRYGDNIVMTPGQQSGCYTWNGDTTIAPALIDNAPTDVNYLFVSDSILVTLGHDVENKIFASDQGDYTQWTASATNQVYENAVLGAGRFISHCPVDGYNLLFTETQTYTFKYVGIQAGVWQVLPLDTGIGLISPMARISINGIAYWMGQDNFYWFRGGKIEVMPCNFATESSILRFVFKNKNYSQRYKFFAGYNEEYDEIWFGYAAVGSNECNKFAYFSRKLQCWVPNTLARSAWEYPTANLSNPRAANGSSLFTHESGANDDTTPLPWSATMKKFKSGKNTVIQSQIMPDCVMTGTANVQHRTYNYAQSQTPMNDLTYPFTGTTEKIPVQLNGRYWDYTISGDDLDQTFLMGQWMEGPQQAGSAP